MNDVLQELRALGRLAGPVVLVQLSLMSMGVVDLMMVGRLGSEPMAALAVAHTFMFSLFILAMGTLMVLDPLVSQAHGAGELRRCGLWLARGVVAALVMAVPLGLAFSFCTEPLLRIMKQPEPVIPVAGAYMRAVVPGIMFRLLFVAGRQVLLGQGRVRLPLAVALLANVLNVFLDYGLIYGRLGMPELGVVGAGWATSMCDMFMATTLFSVILLDRRWRREQAPRDWASVFDLKALGRFFGLGLPLGVQHGLEGWGFVFSTLMAGWLGATVVAGHQVALNLASIAYMLPLGIGAAASVRAGQQVGRRDLSGVRRVCVVAMVGGGISVLLPVSLFVFMPGGLAHLYTSDMAVVAIAVSVLPVAAAFQLFDSVQAIGFGLLRGLGDTRFPALATVIGFWILGIPAGYLLAFHADFGAIGIWLGLAIGLGVVSVLLLLRIRWLTSRPLRRVEPDEVAAPPIAAGVPPTATRRA